MSNKRGSTSPGSTSPAASRSTLLSPRRSRRWSPQDLSGLDCSYETSAGDTGLSASVTPGRGSPSTGANKYGAISVVAGEHRLDSKAEARRLRTLQLLERAGEISRLHVHRVFGLTVHGVLICRYEADFDYRDRQGRLVVEDVKGHRTPAYKLKRRLMLAVHGIDVVEITNEGESHGR